jgi:hypothetical protein
MPLIDAAAHTVHPRLTRIGEKYEFDPAQVASCRGSDVKGPVQLR